jgi:hypothetical protein
MLTIPKTSKSKVKTHRRSRRTKSTNSTRKPRFVRMVAPMNTSRPGGRQNNLSWHPRFLVAFAKCASIKAGCEAAGVDRHTYYAHIRKFPEFAQAVEAIVEEIADNLEHEAMHRAIHGVPKTVRWSKSGEPLMVTKYSDRLLMFMLKKLRPSIYGDKPKPQSF